MRKLVVEFLATFFERYPKTFLFLVIFYMVWPYDFLPEGIVGPIGYLDDILAALLPVLLYQSLKKHKESSQ